jgi:molecular chaperone GrpE
MLSFNRTVRESGIGSAMRKSPESKEPPVQEPAPAPVEPSVEPEPLEGVAEAPAAGPTAVAEPAEQAIQRLEREAADWKDRALRAAADLENFRRRALREREEQFGRGQSDVLMRIVDVVDDLARVAHLDPATTAAAALHEGMLQIERKLMKALELSGLERLDPTGQPFDPNLADAVTMMPAAAPEQDHTVGAVFQAGYRLKGMLLRPARVAVLTWQGAPAAGGEPGSA